MSLPVKKIIIGEYLAQLNPKLYFSYTNGLINKTYTVSQ